MVKWLILAVTLSVGASAAGWALLQPPPGGRRGPGGPGGPPPLRPEVLDQILDDLKLSDKERTKVDEIARAHHEKMRKAIDEATEALKKEMKEILTEEQYTQFKEEFDRRPPPPPPGGPGGGPPGAPRGVELDRLVDYVMSFDKNKDGKVTKDEVPERLHYLFEQGDTNKDGALDKDELKALAEKLNEKARPRGRGEPEDDDAPPPPPR